MLQQQGRKLAYVCVVLNAIIVGFSFLFTKVALEQASPLDTLAYRFAISFGVMTLLVACGRVKLNYRGKPLIKAVLLTVFYPLGFFTFQAFGLQYATSAEGGILFAFTPVLTMLLAFAFLKEKTTVRQQLAIFLSVFGVAFIFIMKGSGLNLSNLTGILLLTLSCLASAGYSVLARSLVKSYSPAEITYFMLGTGFAVYLAASFFSHTAAGTLDRLFAPLASGSFIAAMLYLGILSSLVTALSSNYALSKIEAARMSAFNNLSTVVSIAAGALFLGEIITWYHLIGSVLVITGVLGANLPRRSSSKTAGQAKQPGLEA
ncbi:DMT family transporter [Paenibacillus thalictri]|uniref:DMT family transporter n=1 Tax=Paenibacillus thalictri TaxID=2527873 RepID=A0A4V6MSJ1_9BACL|nr:DMT family transporter [Paenibacillus thalictri]TBL81072.1 DMT family transporter [Paenibacillus thalictri]